MRYKSLIRLINRYLLALHINLFKVASALISLPWFWCQKRKFKKLLYDHRLSKQIQWNIIDHPMLLDRKAESALLGEYFWQDILVAKEIIKQSPERHVDIGSRVDGFIAHLSCIRKVEVFDIRPLNVTIDNVLFTQWDITNPTPYMKSSVDCVSCLHTLEHIGLGRYGDQLDPDGWEKALMSLTDLLSVGGNLWISVPIGRQRIEFNAQRIFNPSTIIDAASNFGVSLSRFFYLTSTGFVESKDIHEDILFLSSKLYGLGIFAFTKY